MGKKGLYQILQWWKVPIVWYQTEGIMGQLDPILKIFMNINVEINILYITIYLIVLIGNQYIFMTTSSITKLIFSSRVFCLL